MVSEHIILNSCDVDLTFYECPAEFFVAQMTDSEVENLAKSASSSDNDFFLTGAENVRESGILLEREMYQKFRISTKY